MITEKKLAPHETFDLHEILTFKNLCATKSATMAILVKDEKLKSLMQQDLILSQSHIKELKELILSSEFLNQANAAKTH